VNCPLKESQKVLTRRGDEEKKSAEKWGGRTDFSEKPERAARYSRKRKGKTECKPHQQAKKSYITQIEER